MQLRPYQQSASNYIVDWFGTAGPRDRQAFTAPTGTGKSYIILDVWQRLHDLICVIPKREIIFDMLDKIGVQGSVSDLESYAEANRLWTPITLRNRLAQGLANIPKKLLFDEVHHSEAETYELLNILSGHAPAVGLTATFFRGTPKETKKLKDSWGEPIPIITLKEARDDGYISIPVCKVLPLIDDDIIAVSNGEFAVSSINDATKDVFGVAAGIIKSYFSEGYFDRPTLVSWPSRECVRAAANEFVRQGVSVVCVDADTPKDVRQDYFKRAVNREAVLFHINVVSEGIDLPLRRMFDFHPTLSPLLWFQQLGRITRPVGGESLPEYFCTNRNFERHCYLLDGMLPISQVKAALEEFEPSKRRSVRALGLESFGRFKATHVHMLNGLKASLYCVSQVVDNKVVNYAAVTSPLSSEVMYVTRTDVKRDDGLRDFGKWERIDALPEITNGFKSMPAAVLSPNMKKWWVSAGKRFGIDTTKEVTRDGFQLLPILKDTTKSSKL